MAQTRKQTANAIRKRVTILAEALVKVQKEHMDLPYIGNKLIEVIEQDIETALQELEQD